MDQQSFARKWTDGADKVYLGQRLFDHLQSNFKKKDMPVLELKWGDLSEDAKQRFIDAACSLAVSFMCDLFDRADPRHFEGQVLPGVKAIPITEDTPVLSSAPIHPSSKEDVTLRGSEQTDEVLAERHAIYGHFYPGHTHVGQIWTAMLRSFYGQPDLPDMPADVVCLLKAAEKLHRAVLPGGRDHYDSHTDGIGYIKLARLASKIIHEGLSWDDALTYVNKEMGDE